MSKDEICGSKHFGPGGGMSLPEESQSTFKRNELVEQTTFIRDDEESRKMLLLQKIKKLEDKCKHYEVKERYLREIIRNVKKAIDKVDYFEKEEKKWSDLVENSTVKIKEKAEAQLPQSGSSKAECGSKTLK